MTRKRRACASHKTGGRSQNYPRWYRRLADMPVPNLDTVRPGHANKAVEAGVHTSFVHSSKKLHCLQFMPHITCLSTVKDTASFFLSGQWNLLQIQNRVHHFQACEQVHSSSLHIWIYAIQTTCMSSLWLPGTDFYHRCSRFDPDSLQISVRMKGHVSCGLPLPRSNWRTLCEHRLLFDRNCYNKTIAAHGAMVGQCRVGYRGHGPRPGDLLHPVTIVY